MGGTLPLCTCPEHSDRGDCLSPARSHHGCRADCLHSTHSRKVHSYRAPRTVARRQGPSSQLTLCSRHFIASSNRLRSPGEERQSLRAPSAQRSCTPPSIKCAHPVMSQVSLNAFSAVTPRFLKQSTHWLILQNAQSKPLTPAVRLVRSRPAVLSKKPTETVNIYLHRSVAVLLGDSLYTDGY